MIKTYFLGLMISLITLTGCGLPSATLNQNFNDRTAQAADSLNTTVQDIGNTLDLQNQITQLFVADAGTADIYYPVTDYTTSRTAGMFSQYVPDHGYLTGDDLQFSDLIPTPVYAITDATVVWEDTLADYGGTIILSFTASDNIVYHALYSGVDLSKVALKVGDTVTAGSTLGVLSGIELHFNIYPYTTAELFTMYVSIDSDLTHWTDPAAFLRFQQAQNPSA